MRKVRIGQSIALLVLVASILAVQTQLICENTVSSSPILIIQIGTDPTVESSARTIEKYLSEYRDEQLMTGRDTDSSVKFADSQFGTMNVDDIDTPVTVAIAFTRMVISLDDLNQKLSRQRASLVIVVAHATLDGVIDREMQISWEKVADSISSVNPEFTIMCSCFGDVLSEYIENSWGFENEIDAMSAALIVSGLLISGLGGSGSTTAEAVLTDYLTHIACIMAGSTTVECLGRPVWADSFYLLVTGAGFVGFMILTLAPLQAAQESASVILASMGKAAMGYVFWVVFPAIIIILISWILGWNNIATAFWSLVIQILVTIYSPFSPSLVSLDLAAKSVAISSIFTASFYAQFSGPWGWAAKISLVVLLAAMVTSLLFCVLDLFSLWNYVPH